MVGRGLAAFGQIDILVNNAGTIICRAMSRHHPGGLDRTMAVNVRSVYLFCGRCCRDDGAALPAGS